jgi:hypothetical protein
LHYSLKIAFGALELAGAVYVSSNGAARNLRTDQNQPSKYEAVLAREDTPDQNSGRHHLALPLAGPVTRFLAWAIDMACLLVASNVLAPVLNLLKLVNGDAAEALGILLFFLSANRIWHGCGVVLERSNLGQEDFAFAGEDAQGLRLRGSQIVLRNLLRFVDGLPAFQLGGRALVLLQPTCSTPGDFAAKHRGCPATNSFGSLISINFFRGKYNSLLQASAPGRAIATTTVSEEASLILSALFGVTNSRLNRG